MDFTLKLIDKVGKGYLSYSSIKYALKDMRLWEMYMKGQLKKESAAFTFGGMYDCMLFTPDEFDKRYFVLDDSEIVNAIVTERPQITSPRMTAKYKNWLKDYEEEVAEKGMEMISQEDVTKSEEMIQRLKDTGVLEGYLQGDYQHEFSTDLDGIPVRGFLDCLGANYITDLKSARDLMKFRYDVRSFDYDIQAHIYTQVLGIDTFYWVAQEKNYPYPIGVFEATEETLESGRAKFNRAVQLIQMYLEEKDCNTYYIFDRI